MKILTAEQIRALDAFTIENRPIASIDLMERAASECSLEFRLNEPERKTVVIVCGKGNNGGDGLAMAAQLAPHHDVTAIVIEHSERGSDDHETNLKRVEKLDRVRVKHVKEPAQLPELQPDSVVVDALFGTGLSRPLEGLVAEVVTWINASEAKVFSIDMPSGLFAEDNSENEMDYVVKADHTFTFHCPKVSFLLPDTAPFVGEWTVLDIGLMEEEFGPESVFEITEWKPLSTYLPPRARFSHKGTFGHALLLAGSKGKMGAAQLAASACLRSGTGLLSCAVPASGNDIMQMATPEAMTMADSQSDHLSEVPKLAGFSAIGIGPGIGQHEDTASMLKRLIQESPIPLVLDADALNLIAQHPTWLSFLPKGSILTPHPKEFDRLFGTMESASERLKMQMEQSQKLQIVIVLKGAYTSITTPVGQVFFNPTGNPGLATGGSGDVLTGILLGLMAQGYASSVAAVLGTYVHGLAAELAVKRISQRSLLASDVIHHLGEAFLKLESDAE